MSEVERLPPGARLAGLVDGLPRDPVLEHARRLAGEEVAQAVAGARVRVENRGLLRGGSRRIIGNGQRHPLESAREGGATGPENLVWQDDGVARHGGRGAS